MKTSATFMALYLLAFSLSPAGESVLQGEGFFSTLVAWSVLQRLKCNALRRKTETCRRMVKREGLNRKGNGRYRAIRKNLGTRSHETEIQSLYYRNV